MVRTKSTGLWLKYIRNGFLLVCLLLAIGIYIFLDRFACILSGWISTLIWLMNAGIDITIIISSLFLCFFLFYYIDIILLYLFYFHLLIFDINLNLIFFFFNIAATDILSSLLFKLWFIRILKISTIFYFLFLVALVLGIMDFFSVVTSNFNSFFTTAFLHTHIV